MQKNNIWKPLGVIISIATLIITISIYASNRIRESGKLEMKVDRIDLDQKTHVAWSEKRNDVLISQEVKLEAINVSLKNIEKKLDEINKKLDRKR